MDSIFSASSLLISGEPREIIIQAFVNGAGLTPKGAQTYFYNCKRNSKNATTAE